jgi:hypothetical protein
MNASMQGRKLEARASIRPIRPKVLFERVERSLLVLLPHGHLLQEIAIFDVDELLELFVKVVGTDAESLLNGIGQFHAIAEQVEHVDNLVEAILQIDELHHEAALHVRHDHLVVVGWPHKAVIKLTDRLVDTKIEVYVSDRADGQNTDRGTPGIGYIFSDGKLLCTGLGAAKMPHTIDTLFRLIPCAFCRTERSFFSFP